MRHIKSIEALLEQGFEYLFISGGNRIFAKTVYRTPEINIVQKCTCKGSKMEFQTVMETEMETRTSKSFVVKGL